MKRSNLFWVSLVLAALLGGCRWDGNSILGNDPEEKFEQVVQSWQAYDLCRDQRVSVAKVENAAGCATPSLMEITDFSVSSTDKLRIAFSKMWDGTFPKLIRLRYRTKKYSGYPAKVRDVPCKLGTGTASERVYECSFPEVDYSTQHFFTDIDVGHDTCPAHISYKAEYLFPMCNTYEYQDVETVWWEGRRLPELQEPVKPKTP